MRNNTINQLQKSGWAIRLTKNKEVIIANGQKVVFIKNQKSFAEVINEVIKKDNL